MQWALCATLPETDAPPLPTPGPSRVGAMQPVQPASAGGLWSLSILETSTSFVLHSDPQDPERRRLGGRTLSIFLNEGQSLQLPLPLAPLLGGCVSKPREFVKMLGNLPHDQSLFSLRQLQHSHIPPTTACKTKPVWPRFRPLQGRAGPLSRPPSPAPPPVTPQLRPPQAMGWEGGARTRLPGAHRGARAAVKVPLNRLCTTSRDGPIWPGWFLPLPPPCF